MWRPPCDRPRTCTWPACAYSLVAIRAYPDARAVALVTGNTKDFMKARLAKLGIVLERPDAFLLALFKSQPLEFASAFRRFRADLVRSPRWRPCWSGWSATAIASGSRARRRAASRRRRNVGCLPAGKAYLDAQVAI